VNSYRASFTRHGPQEGTQSRCTSKLVGVHGVLAGAIDTDMTRAMTSAKANPRDVANAILRGVEQGNDDIVPDEMSRGAFDTWRKDPKQLERQLAGL